MTSPSRLPSPEHIVRMRLRDNPNLTYVTYIKFPGSGYCQIVEMTAIQQAQLIGLK